MPKLVVLVEKDDTGKLWNYIFTEQDWVRNQNSFGTTSQWVHKSDSSENSPQCVRPTEPTEKDHVTIGLLLPRQEASAGAQIRYKE